MAAGWTLGAVSNMGMVLESSNSTADALTPLTTTTYYQGDQIGSARILTAAGGWPLSSDAYYPFGLEQTVPTDANHYKYTGLERDGESGMDTATFRTYANLESRWTRPDPYDGSYDLSNPQSFNRYAYVLNNPLSYTDPSGLLTQPNPPPDCNANAAQNGCAAPPTGSAPSPPWWIVDQGGVYGQPGGTCLARNGSAFPCPSINPAAPSNPCAYRGTAKTPSQYAAAGQNFKNTYINPAIDAGQAGGDGSGLLVGGLFSLYSNFHRGGALDAQSNASGNGLQRATYGNYAYGVYFAAAGFSLPDALSAASAYGYKQQILNGAYKGRAFGPYGGIPVENVQDITAGYNAQMSGATCH